MGRPSTGVYLVRHKRASGSRHTLAVLPIPSEPGRYFLTDPIAVVQGCPRCHARAGEPCRTHGHTYPAGARYHGRHRATICRERRGPPGQRGRWAELWAGAGPIMDRPT